MNVSLPIKLGVISFILFVFLSFFYFSSRVEESEPLLSEIVRDDDLTTDAFGSGVSIAEIPGYQSDKVVHKPGTGIPVFGMNPDMDYTYIKVDVAGHLLCAKVDGTVWKLTLTDKLEQK